MDFDINKYNANRDREASFKPGTREWDKRIKEQMYQDKLKTPISQEYLEKLGIIRKEKEDEKKKDDGGCVITSACIKSKNLSDDSEILIVLRWFRDNYLSKTKEGNADLQEYYRLAPLIVEKIEIGKNSKFIYDNIYENMLIPSVQHILKQEFQEAYYIYKKGMLELKTTFLN